MINNGFLSGSHERALFTSTSSSTSFPTSFINLYTFNGRLHDYHLEVLHLEGVLPLEEKREERIPQGTREV
jgi:hypothetical protein